MKKEIVPQDKNYYLILDNDVIGHLVDAYFNIKNPKTWAKNFYIHITENNIKLLGTDLTFFEYLRGAENFKEYKTKLKYLEKIFTSYISGVDTLDSIEMTVISNIYSLKKACKTVPSFVDLYLTLILKNLSDKQIVLATFNYKDFPTTFLDRKIKSIDFGYEIKNLCFYKFNSLKYKACLKDFFDTPSTKNKKKHHKKK